MLTVVLGENNSGKSAYAESLAVEYAAEEGGKLYYIATMMPYGDDGQDRVKRHRAQRTGKGFMTIESPSTVARLGIAVGSTILIEDISNLLANKIFESGQTGSTGEAEAEAVLNEILELSERRNVVAVTITGLSGEGYSEETINYIRALDVLNTALVDYADKAYRLTGGKAKQITQKRSKKAEKRAGGLSDGMPHDLPPDAPNVARGEASGGSGAGRRSERAAGAAGAAAGASRRGRGDDAASAGAGRRERADDAAAEPRSRREARAERESRAGGGAYASSDGAARRGADDGVDAVAASCATAFSAYTAFPVAVRDWKPEAMRYALYFLPLCGLPSFALLVGWGMLCQWLGVGTFLFAAVATILPILVTGGIHMDGFMDTVDALSSRTDREKMLDIMKDPRTGAFAVIFCCTMFLALFGAFSQVGAAISVEDGGLLKLLVIIGLGYVLSRAWTALSAFSLPGARPSGFFAAFTEYVQRSSAQTAMIVVVVACSVVMILISAVAGSCAAVAGAVCYLIYRRAAMNKFGGVTGDTCGFVLQVIELAIVIACAAAQAGAGGAVSVGGLPS